MKKCLRNLWNNIKHTNIQIIWVPEVEEREKRTEKCIVFEEIMAENFPNLKKETDIHVQEAQRVPNKMNPNRPTLGHIIIKTTKVKERILKVARQKQSIIYKGTLKNQLVAS